MKFSIITATKNNKAGLLRSIECVRNQTYQNVEHIIVDGGSTDGTVEILRAAAQVRQTQCDKNGAVILNGMRDLPSPLDFSPAAQNDNQKSSLITNHYSLIAISEADSGIYDAINKGIKLATGDVIGLLHSDDLYADEKVLTEYANAFAKKDVEAVYSDLVYVKSVNSEQRIVNSKRIENDSLLTNNYSPFTNYSIIRFWKAHSKTAVNSEQKIMKSKRTDHDSLITNHSLQFGWMPPHPTLFIRKEIFEKYGLYDTSFKIAADYDMILRLFYKHKITAHYLPLTTYLMSLGGASNKSVKNILLKSKEDLQALKLHDLPHPLITLISKNFRKLPQFMIRDLS